MAGKEAQAAGGGIDAGGAAAGGDKKSLAGADVLAVHKTGAGNAYHNQEGIVQRHIHGPGKVVKRSGEVLAADKLYRGVLPGLVRGPVSGQDTEVDGLEGKVRVQLAGLSVKAKPAVVPDAVRKVRCLLDLCQKAARTNCVDSAGRQEKHIPWLHLISGQYVRNGAVCNAALVLLPGDLLLKAAVESGAGLGGNYVPHFRLSAELRAVDAAGHGIVRMDLNGEVAVRVDEFDEEGKNCPNSLVDVFSKKLLLIHGTKLKHAHAPERTVVHQGEVLAVAGYFPGFAYLGQVPGDTFIG